MGTTTSRIGSEPPSTRVNRRNRVRSRLSTLLICGCSSSNSLLETEDRHAAVGASSSKDCNSIVSVVQKGPENYPLETSGEPEISYTSAETGTSSESSDETSEYSSVVNGLSSVQTTNKQGTCLTKTEELLAPFQVRDESCRNKSAVASTSFREEQSSDPVNVSVCKEPTSCEISVIEPVSCMCPGPSNSHSPSPSGRIPDETHFNEFGSREANMLGIDSCSYMSGSQETCDPLRDTAVSSDSEPIVFNTEQSEGNDGFDRVELVTSPSNILSDANNDSSNHEVRRYRGRLVLDAISRRGSRRMTEYPNTDFSSGDSDPRQSQSRRFSNTDGDFSSDGLRMNGPNEQRLRSRSQIWERLFTGINESGQRDNFCPFGVHPDGFCSCNSFLTNDESSIHASISRIVMLAEALFEVLDEIHHRPASFSLPMVSLPAPESVVDSFPVKDHKKLYSAEIGDEVQQCYICLAEYEEGDKIRVLPCHHEYHMSCVDKWLKEIHGVCPLCRGEVAQGAECG